VGEISANFRPNRPTHSETTELSLARMFQKYSGDLNPDVSRKINVVLRGFAWFCVVRMSVENF
jgi:hypothetical protein